MNPQASTDLPEIEKQFRQIQPVLTALARGLTHNPKIVVKPNYTSSTTLTDGKTYILIAPPKKLAILGSHTRSLCGMRSNETRLKLCAECARRESILWMLMHEVGHIAQGSFKELPSYLTPEVPATPWLKPEHRERFESCWKFPRTFTNKVENALSLSQYVGRYFKTFFNGTEDMRMEAAVSRLYPAAAEMFEAGYMELMSNVDTWGDEKRNIQIIKAIIFARYSDISKYYDAQIVEHLNDSIVTKLVEGISKQKSALDLLLHVIPLYGRLVELGYFDQPEKEEEEPEDVPLPDPNAPKSEGPKSEDGTSSPERSSENDDSSDSGEQQDEASNGGEGSGESGGSSDSGSNSEDNARSSSPRDPGDAGKHTSSGSSGSDSGDDSGSDGDEPADRGGSSRGPRDGGSGDGSPVKRHSSSNEGDWDLDEDLFGDSKGKGTPNSGEPTGEESPQEPGTDQSDSAWRDERTDSSDSSGAFPEEEGSDEYDSSSANPSGCSGVDGRDDSGATSGFDDTPEYSSPEAGVPGGTGLDRSPVDPVDYGDPDEVESSLQEFLRHSEDGHVDKGDVEYLRPYEATKIVAEINRAPEYDMGSATNMGISWYKLKTETWNWVRDRRSPSLENSTTTRMTPGRLDGYHITGDSLVAEYMEKFKPKQEMLGRELLRLKIFLEENKRSSYTNNLKSGRVRPSVLGKRAAAQDPRMFRKKSTPGKRDYEVVISVDCSSSTGAGHRLDQEKQAVMAQAELLSQLGIKFSIFGHSGHYDRSSDGYGVRFYLTAYEVKSVEEPWSTAQKQRLICLPSDAANLDGHALQVSISRMRLSQATEKIIMYYTDGGMPMEDYVTELDTLKRGIEECKRRKITLMAVGIRTDSPLEYGLDTVILHSADDISPVVTHLGKRLGSVLA